jgi:hypothetical protein
MNVASDYEHHFQIAQTDTDWVLKHLMPWDGRKKRKQLELNTRPDLFAFSHGLPTTPIHLSFAK